MEFHDKVLKCSECNSEFVFTAGEQMFFADKGFKNEPKRCKGCKAKRAEGVGAGTNGGGGAPMRSETKTNCSQCGKDTHGAVPSDARPARVLPRMLPTAPRDGRSVVPAAEFADRSCQPAAVAGVMFVGHCRGAL